MDLEFRTTDANTNSRASCALKLMKKVTDLNKILKELLFNNRLKEESNCDKT